MNKIPYKKLICYLLFCLGMFAGADEGVFHLGGKHGWNNLSHTENLTMRAGRYGYSAMALASPKEQIRSDTDLYMSFDGSHVYDAADHYAVLASHAIASHKDLAKYGEAAGLFNTLNSDKGVILDPKPDAFFAGNKPLSSFSIDFWINPAVAENGTVFLQWRSSLVQGFSVSLQNIICRILKNKMEWVFSNIWQSPEGKPIDIRVLSKSNIVPSTWSNHRISYDARTGLLEYRMNGLVESVQYVTTNYQESGTVLTGFLGKSAQLHVGKRYSGLIDELVVKTEAYYPQSLDAYNSLFNRYAKTPGRFESSIVDMGGRYSMVEELKADVFLPYQTDVAFFVRSADSPFNWTKDYPVWKPVFAKTDIRGVRGRYFQIAAEVYTNAQADESPLINSVSVYYYKDSLPEPPIRITAQAKDGAVELTWSPSIALDAKGYYLYFGENTGEYMAQGSPIDVGKTLSYTVKGLENGKLYFFAVAAYDHRSVERVGSLSKETWARPLQGLPE